MLDANQLLGEAKKITGLSFLGILYLKKDSIS